MWYKKYGVYQCSDNIGITNCTTYRVTTHNTFLRLAKTYNWNGTRIVSFRLIEINIDEHSKYSTTYDCH
jgi:hypothetical protein